jgi:hypothetical protein
MVSIKRLRSVESYCEVNYDRRVGEEMTMSGLRMDPGKTLFTIASWPATEMVLTISKSTRS